MSSVQILDSFLLLHVLYIIGIVTEGMTGAVAAGRKGMDIFGIITIACITGLGGGTVSDTLLGIHPLTWIDAPSYIVMVMIAAVVAVFIVNFIARKRKLFLILDAMGLVTFAYLGSTIAYHATRSIIIAIIMGVLTGVAGGMLRDILCNDIPLVFKSELYASIAIIVSALTTISIVYGFDSYISATIILLIGFALRMLAIFKNIKLPSFQFNL